MGEISKDLAIICYLAENLSDLYQTKLYKLLFYIDFLFYKRTEVSITGEIYYKLPYGPVPLSIKSRIDFIITEKVGVSLTDIEDEDEQKKYELYSSYLGIDKKKTKEWYIKYAIICKQSINLAEHLSEKEISIVEEVKDKLGRLGTKEIVDKSHKETWYLNTEMFRPIYFWFADNLSI